MTGKERVARDMPSPLALIIGLVAIAVISAVAIFLGSTVTLETRTGTPVVMPTPTATAPPTASTETPESWQEDGLPPVMYLWRDRYGGTFHRLSGYWSDGQGGEHLECWIITGNTALVMCPDGWSSTS